MTQLDGTYTDQELVAMPRVNVQLLDEVLDYIIEHPDEWDQNWFSQVTDKNSCGTTFCFAGHACVLAGDEVVRSEYTGELRLVRPDHKGWFDAAMEHLGLIHEEAWAMFYSTITVEEDEDTPLSEEEYRRRQLQNVKVEVERIRARAKAQDAAFNRLAQEFIDAAGLDDVVQPGYKCPESAEVLQGNKGGASE